MGKRRKHFETQLQADKASAYFRKKHARFIPIHRLINRPVGTPEEQKLIDNHLKKLFEENPGYKPHFTYLEWYHMFLDFTITQKQNESTK